jgi:DnaJ-class molecular chaperone
MYPIDRVPPEVKSREDLRDKQCPNCLGEGRVIVKYVGNIKEKCFECNGEGFKIEKKCPECDSWTLKWTDAPQDCENCGYHEEAHPRYREAMNEVDAS